MIANQWNSSKSGESEGKEEEDVHAGQDEVQDVQIEKEEEGWLPPQRSRK